VSHVSVPGAFRLRFSSIKRHKNCIQTQARLIEEVALKIEKKGIEAWFELDAADLLGAADAALYEKVTDTLDVWFDSGVSHFSVVDQRSELQYPADLYLEGSDQHRGWFQVVAQDSGRE
jgi:isoleucyl-tRNA synthetase